MFTSLKSSTESAPCRDRISVVRPQGMDPERRYWFRMVGYNYRMTNIQAAIGLAQLEQVDYHLAKRRTVAEWYQRHLSPLNEFLTLPLEEPWARHAFWIYTILLKESARISRDAFMESLLGAGIETRPVFYPMHVMRPYREPDGTYPVAEDLARRGVNLPTHGELTEEDIEYIASTIRKICTQTKLRSAVEA